MAGVAWFGAGLCGGTGGSGTDFGGDGATFARCREESLVGSSARAHDGAAAGGVSSGIGSVVGYIGILLFAQ